MELDDKQKNHINSAYFVYDVTQLLRNNQSPSKGNTKETSLGFIVMWVVLPFLVGSVLLFFAARYLIRSFSAYPTQLIEEDAAEPNQNASEEVFKNNKDVDPKAAGK